MPEFKDEGGFCIGFDEVFCSSYAKMNGDNFRGSEVMAMKRLNDF
jgi:hypothetical protein